MHIQIAGCIPRIPIQGTVGASGDLAPLSHLVLALIGEGEMWSFEEEKWVLSNEVPYRNLYFLNIIINWEILKFDIIIIFLIY